MVPLLMPMYTKTRHPSSYRKLPDFLSFFLVFERNCRAEGIEERERNSIPLKAKTCDCDAIIPHRGIVRSGQKKGPLQWCD